MKRTWIAGAVAVSALLLLGCGGGSEPATQAGLRPLSVPREMHLGLDGYTSPATAGILLAEKRGYFAALGVELLTTSPVSPLRPVQYVNVEEVDIGISHEPQVVLAQEKGVPIVAIGSLVSEPTTALMWLEKSNIRGIADLKGKTVAIPGLSFQEEFLRSLLAEAGLTLDDVELVTAEYELVQALVSGRADAIFGGTRSVEGVELESRGFDPVVTDVRRLGVPNYDELVLVARGDRLSDDPRLYRNFMAAVARGTADAIEDPQAAADVISESVNGTSEMDRKEALAGIEQTLPLLSRSGKIDPASAENLSEWMREEGMIRRALPASEWLTNGYSAPLP